MTTVDRPDVDPVELPPRAGIGKLPGYGTAWHEAVEIAEA
jgi:hypothetical protein